MSIYTGEENGTLTINPDGSDPGEMEIVLPNPACGGELDLTLLWTAIEVRGDNAEVPGRAGRLAFQKVLDEVTVDLLFTIVGDCDADGDPPAGDTLEQLQENIDFLFANLNISPTGPTRTAVLVKPNGDELTAEVQTLFRTGGHLGAVEVTGALSITLVDGAWEPAGS